MIFCALVLTTELAPAAVLVSTFSNTPPGFVDSFAYGINAVTVTTPPPFSSTTRSYGDWAMGFVPGISGIAETVTLPLRFESGNQLRISLAEESPSGAPGAILDSTLLNSTAGAELKLYSVDFTASPSLVAGHHYWLIASIEGSVGSLPGRMLIRFSPAWASESDRLDLAILVRPGPAKPGPS